MPFCEVQIDQRIRQEADRRSALYKGALEGILKQGSGQVLVALWCGDVLAPDALWYFAQLAQVLLSDPSGSAQESHAHHLYTTICKPFADHVQVIFKHVGSF